LIEFVIFPHHQESLFMTSPVLYESYPYIQDGLLVNHSGKMKAYFPQLPNLIDDKKPKSINIDERIFGKVKVSAKDILVSTHNIFFRFSKDDIVNIFKIITFVDINLDFLTTEQYEDANWDVKPIYILDFLNDLTLNQKMYFINNFFWTDDFILKNKIKLLTEIFSPPFISNDVSVYNFRPHQDKGIKFIHKNQENYNLTLLNYDMGAGKTRMILSLVKNIKGLVLIVLKSSLISGLIKEAKDLNIWNSINLHVIYNNEALFEYKGSKNVIITYEFLSRYKGEFREPAWSILFEYMITDESQVLQNPTSNVFQNLINLSSIRTAFFSGTPMRNGVKDSYYLMYYAKLFTGSHNSYNAKMQAKIGNKSVYALNNHSEFAINVKQYISEFTISYKNDFKFKVREFNLPVYLRKDELDYYKDELEEAYKIVIQLKGGKEVKVKDEERGVFTTMDIIAKISRMIAIASNFRLKDTLFTPNGISLNAFNTPTKFRALKSILRHHKNDKILVFVALKSVGKSYSRMLSDLSFPNYYSDGSVDKDIRFSLVERFNQDNAPKNIFIATRDSMKYGLNFSNTSVIINIDRSWTPADNEQANARIKRLSQKNEEVTIYNVFSVDTIDEYMRNVTLLKGNALKDFWNIKSDYNVFSDYKKIYTSLFDMIEQLQTNTIPRDRKLDIPILIESEDIDYTTLRKFMV